MKAPLAILALTLSSYAALAGWSKLGLLGNYYHDCPASRGPQAAYLRGVITRALSGDQAAMRSVIMHRGIFSTGDNEGYTEVSEALLRTLGDSRYAAFVISQPLSVRNAALLYLPGHSREFARTYPRTAKLYHAWIAGQRHTSNQTLERTADPRINLLLMASTLSAEAPLAPVSGRSACSR